MDEKPIYKELEQRVKELEKEAVLKQAQQLAHVGTWEWNLIDNSFEMSDEMCRIYGIKGKSKFDNIKSLIHEAIHPDDRKVIDKATEAVAEDFAEGAMTYRVIRPDGKIRWIAATQPEVRRIGKDGKPAVIMGAVQDITEWKQAEEALRKSEEKYRTLLETTSEGCWLINPELKTIEVNEAICKMLGYSQDEMIGKTPFDFVDDENRKIFIEQTSKISTTPHRSYEITLKKKNGQDLHTYFNATTIRDESGQVLGAFAFITDITEKKRAEEALRESVERYRNIFKNIQDVYYEVTLDGIILEASPSIEEVLLYKREEIIGKSLSEIYIDPKNIDEFLKELLKNGKVTGYEILLKDKDGSEVYCSITAKLVSDKHGKPVKIIGSMHNINEQKRAKEQIHALTNELIKSQENERQRISRDLHDNVAQELSAVRIGCETLFDHQLAIPPEIRRKVSEMSKTLQKSIKAVRDLSYDLRPPVLDEMGLVQTIFQYCQDFSENNGINVDLHSAGMKDLNLDFDTEINLYRLIQEGLANIKKHAAASNVTVKLVAAFPNIILRIEDDGKGFDVQKRMATITKEKRMGIQSMEQRAKLLKGEMEIQSKPMQGTKISIMLPYKGNKTAS